MLSSDQCNIERGIPQSNHREYFFWLRHTHDMNQLLNHMATPYLNLSVKMTLLIVFVLCSHSEKIFRWKSEYGKFY